jgi:hypothetical protein
MVREIKNFLEAICESGRKSHQSCKLGFHLPLCLWHAVYDTLTWLPPVTTRRLACLSRTSLGPCADCGRPTMVDPPPPTSRGLRFDGKYADKVMDETGLRAALAMW